jgi:hypothetical protein
MQSQKRRADAFEPEHSPRLQPFLWCRKRCRQQERLRRRHGVPVASPDPPSNWSVSDTPVGDAADLKRFECRGSAGPCAPCYRNYRRPAVGLEKAVGRQGSWPLKGCQHIQIEHSTAALGRRTYPRFCVSTVSGGTASSTARRRLAS